MATEFPSLTTWTGQTINYEAYDEGERFLGHVSIDLPEITYHTQDITGAGIAGTVNMPSRWLTESLTLTVHWRSMTQWAMHLAQQQGHDLTFYGAINAYNSGGASPGLTETSIGQKQYSNSKYHEHSTKFEGAGDIRAMPVVIFTRCLSKKTSFGKFQPNELMDNESEFELTYIKATIDGYSALELDKFNYTLMINGKDYAGDVRSILGLGGN